jgi:hypothetical protein
MDKIEMKMSKINEKLDKIISLAEGRNSTSSLSFEKIQSEEALCEFCNNLDTVQEQQIVSVKKIKFFFVSLHHFFLQINHLKTLGVGRGFVNELHGKVALILEYIFSKDFLLGMCWAEKSG